MTSLLSRLQSLTGPSREIDAEIALDNGWTKERDGIDFSALWRDPEGYSSSPPPRYTESLDVALTLVPDGASWKMGTYITTGTYRACVLSDEQESSGYGTTPAITLLIAIYRMKEGTKS